MFTAARGKIPERDRLKVEMLAQIPPNTDVDSLARTSVRFHKSVTQAFWRFRTSLVLRIAMNPRERELAMVTLPELFNEQLLLVQKNIGSQCVYNSNPFDVITACSTLVCVLCYRWVHAEPGRRGARD